MISEKFPRFCALDRARGLAMILMVMAHFGPGVYERLGIGGTALDILNVLGRMATPSFIMIFGITLAFVHIRKAQANEPGLRRSLTKRAGMVFVFSLVVSLPQSLDHVFNTQAAGLGEWLYGLALRQYNVLTFYALAILTTAVFIHHIARDPLRRGLLYGATLVFTGSFLGYDAWPEQPGGAVELLRLVLVSGKYAVFTSLGLAWMMIAVGIIMRDRLKARQTFHQDIATIAVVLCLTGLATGRIVGWRELSDLHLHYNGPPQYWYMTMVAGVLLLSLLALDRFTVPTLGKVLGIVGRSPLHFYVAHAFVLPAVGLIRFLTPGVSDTAAIGLSMGAFVVYCGLKISREYRTGPMGRRPLVGLNP